MEGTEIYDSTVSVKDPNNIKVCLRIRPLNSREQFEGSQNLLETCSNSVLISKGDKEKKKFNYDQVFDQNESQSNVFKTVGCNLVENFLEGYNCTIFAYGQTGAGKTYTMLGDSSNDEERGLQLRCLEYLFYSLKQHRESENLIKITYVEIYNEKIIDLLCDRDINLNLREDIEKGVFIENVKEVVVNNYHEAYDIITQGVKRRHVSETNMNEQSSRSHSVFTIHYQTFEKRADCSSFKTAKFNFVDLAGSERQKLAKSVGDQLKEGCNINKSLAVLGDVINSLADNSKGKGKYIRYRDSKLTFLLKNSLGGNSKTVFIANVSPSSNYVIETLSTLMFAQRAKLIKNEAKINENVQSESLEALKNELLAQKEMYAKLKEKYDMLENNGFIQQKKIVDKCEKCENTSRTCNNKVLQMNAILKESMIILNKSLSSWEGQIEQNFDKNDNDDIVDALHRNCASIKQLIALLNIDSVRREKSENDEDQLYKEMVVQMKLFEEVKHQLTEEINQYESEVGRLRNLVENRINTTDMIDRQFKDQHVTMDVFNAYKKSSRVKQEQLNLEIEQLKANLLLKDDDIVTLTKSIDSMTQRNQNLIDLNNQIREEKHSLNKALEDLKYEKFIILNQVDQEISALKDLNDKLALDLQSVENEKEVLKTSIYTINTDNKLYATEIKNLKKQIEQLTQENENLAKSHKQTIDENIVLREQKNTLTTDYNALLTKKNDNSGKKNQINENIDTLRKNLKNIVDKYMDINKEVDILSSQLSKPEPNLVESTIEEDVAFRELDSNLQFGKKREGIKSLETSSVAKKNYIQPNLFMSTDFRENNAAKLNQLTKRLKKM